MELLCTENHNDIRFSLKVGDTTEVVPYLTDAEKADMLKDFPDRFVDITKKRKESDALVVEHKVPAVETRKVKMTKK